MTHNWLEVHGLIVILWDGRCISFYYPTQWDPSPLKPRGAVAPLVPTSLHGHIILRDTIYALLYCWGFNFVIGTVSVHWNHQGSLCWLYRHPEHSNSAPTTAWHAKGTGQDTDLQQVLQVSSSTGGLFTASQGAVYQGRPESFPALDGQSGASLCFYTT